MAIPELTRRRAEHMLGKFCEQRVPAHVRHQVRLSVSTRGNNVTLLEHRPVFRKQDEWIDHKVAQFRYDPASDSWTLYCSDRNGRWHRYAEKRPTGDLSVLIHEVDEDPTAIFWG